MNPNHEDKNPPPIPPPGRVKTAYSHWTLLARVTVVGLLLASAGLLWWSYYRVFLPPFKQSRETNTTVVKLSAEVDELDRQWSPTNITRINGQFALVQPRIFTDRTELDAWLADFRDQIAPLGLDLKTELPGTNAPAADATNSLPGTNYTMIPASFTIGFPPLTAPGPGPGPSPSQRLLQFMQRLTSQDKSAVLTGLTAASGTNSLGQAVVGVNFWVNARRGK